MANNMYICTEIVEVAAEMDSIAAAPSAPCLSMLGSGTKGRVVATAVEVRTAVVEVRAAAVEVGAAVVVEIGAAPSVPCLSMLGRGTEGRVVAKRAMKAAGGGGGG